jgi:hypothetical protein
MDRYPLVMFFTKINKMFLFAIFINLCVHIFFMDPELYILKPSILKTIGLLIFSTFFSFFGILFFMNESRDLGILITGFFALSAIIILVKLFQNKPTLLITRQAFCPKFILSKDEEIWIPWTDVTKIEIISQKIRVPATKYNMAVTNIQKYIAISLKKGKYDFNQMSNETTEKITNAIGSSFLEGLDADIYIPSTEFSQNLDKTLEFLKTFFVNSNLPK